MALSESDINYSRVDDHCEYTKPACNDSMVELHSSLSQDWSVDDDILLASCVIHTPDLEKIHNSVSFSKPYSLYDIESHWKNLMFDQDISRRATQSFSKIYLNKVDSIEQKTMYSVGEDKLLNDFYDAPPTLEKMERLLKQEAAMFHYTRTPQLLLDRYALIRAQRSNKIFTSSLDNRVLNSTTENTNVFHDESKFQKVLKASSNLVSKFKCPSNNAALIGRMIDYLIVQDITIIGRKIGSSEDVHVNLSLEGPASKIARKQAVIHRYINEYTIENTGRRPIIVDRKTLLKGDCTFLMSNSIIEMALIRLVFKCL